jgi:hypothetical protein
MRQVAPANHSAIVLKRCTIELTGYVVYFIIRSLFYLFLLTLI